MEEITHECRVTVNSGGILFQTGWYIESHARDVHASLKRHYPAARVTLHRRRIAGDSEVVE
jgi:hypothetical protein